ncbi:MAG: hypothetical protein KDA77_11750 [Planctomycetaceae bacterium]|nr:hypothetical protein [Planctomycetaceae bacterium]
MNSQLTAEVAALIASQSLSLAEGTKPFSPTALYDFWFHGQEHLKQRRKVLEPLANEPDISQISEKELEVIFKDFFAEEMLIRVVTAMFTAADKRRNQCQAEPIARSLLLSFLDVKRLALTILVSEKQMSLETLKGINRIRRSIERWTDLFLGQLVFRFGLEDFAHDVARSRDFGEDQISNLNAPHPVQTWDLITAGLRISFPAGLTSQTDDHWEKMLGAIIACFPAECFNNSATMKSLQRVRIERSGLHPETTPDRLPEQFHTLMYRSLSGTHSQKQSILEQTANFNSDLPPQNHQDPISFSKLKKRNRNKPAS